MTDDREAIGLIAIFSGLLSFLFVGTLMFEGQEAADRLVSVTIPAYMAGSFAVIGAVVGVVAAVFRSARAAVAAAALFGHAGVLALALFLTQTDVMARLFG